MISVNSPHCFNEDNVELDFLISLSDFLISLVYHRI
jgi:hypothetical protein